VVSATLLATVGLWLTSQWHGIPTAAVSFVPIETLGVTALALAYLTVLLSNFMSNTAAANILIPIGVTVAAGHEPRIAVTIALAASAAMCLPIATPPNALVFSTGRCETRDFIRLGICVGLVAPLLAVLWTTWML